ncbi:MAG: peptidoglycan DD-metalloendopeptidase family protein, partial [Acetobacteraceae bacterium]|nr:peptidoglycan DD-metalloendopeptidase family protein [Acetobacteraceae bacterium]
LDEATAALRSEAPKLAAAEAAQAKEASALDRQIAAAQATRQGAEDDEARAARQAASLAAQASTLKAAVAALEAEGRAAEARARADAARARPTNGRRAASPAVPVSPAAPPRGGLRQPVVGTLIRAFGTATDGGPAAGASWVTPPSARVVSPCGGRVVFAAPFRSYGRLLIVDCGGGTHVVLAGLDRLNAAVGDKVQGGEPVGIMPDWQPGTGGSRPALYLELRRGGQAVNPGPWLGRG